jgi:rubrerythrin
MNKLVERICIVCHIGFIEDHPEFPELYWKCPICGYTKPKPKPKMKLPTK